MPPLISIAITNYNREGYLGDAIASVLAQTWQDFELLVWDDGSTDDSVAIAHKYAQQDRRVRVVEGNHQGVAVATKAAIAQTTGTYIGWVDSDDLLAPTALAETAAMLKRHPEIGFVYTDYLDIDTNGKVTNYGHRCRIPYSKERLLIDFMTFHFRLIRRSVYDQVNGIDESWDYAEEYDLCLKLSEVTQVGRVRKPLYYYRIHSGNISQQWLEQNHCSQKIIAQALKRRGLADKLQIDMELPTGHLILRRRKNFLADPPAPLLPAFLFGGLLAIFPLIGAMSPRIAEAQHIVPAADGTGTVVTPHGNIIDINGGKMNSNGTNLFQSFQEFGLQPEQIANFQANPGIKNILGRISGGNASVINGLIQVTGGSANLFLMNPAGFVFGSNASLNVPGAFTATTANGIGFGNKWFNAFGVNDYAVLVGNPSTFAFTMNRPGAIVNFGNLAVGAGQNLTLLGGTVVNTGQLTAPGGQIIVTSVPGQNWVRLSQPGSLLSLEIQPLASSNNPNNWTIPVASLPELLTVGKTGLTANSDGIKLPGSNVTIPTAPGTTIISGKVDVSDQTGGTVNIFGKQVALVHANINASGVKGGGSVRIGGDYRGQEKGTIATGETIASGGGTVTIRHDGGPNNNNVPISIGNASVNGTAGAIRGGNSILPSGNFPVLPNGGTASGTPNGITINSVNTPPTLTANPLLSSNAQPNQSVTFTIPPVVTPPVVTPPVVTPPVVTPPVVTPPVVINCDLQCSPPVQPPVVLPPLVPPRAVLVTDPTPEDKLTTDVTHYLGIPTPPLKTTDDAADIARKIEKATGVKPAFIYISFVPVEIPPDTKQINTLTEQNNDQLELVMVTAKGIPIRKRIAETTRENVLEVAQNFRDEISSPRKLTRTNYLRPAQQLYRWMIAPLKKDLEEQKINNLVFLPDIGLRSIPMAALHDGQGFLVEKYSIGLMPNLTLTNTLYTDIKKSQLLAMGVSQTTQGQIPLPAVPVELSTLVFKLWQGKLFLDKQVTLSNLKAIRRQQPFGIIHMATHADFTGGPVSNSYIQLWDDKLRLNQIRQLGLNKPQVEMLVLSACKTALGDEDAEIGFAGLAVLAGVKTSVASLWEVNDAGTAALMTKFYENLKTAPIRAEALRQAQVAMAKGQIYLKNGQVKGLGIGDLPLPANSVALPDGPLSHPYFWAAFTMVGNPW